MVLWVLLIFKNSILNDMKSKSLIFALGIFILSLISCDQVRKKSETNIIFLHHSTGECIWRGTPPSIIRRAAKKISKKFADNISKKAQLPLLFEKFNKEQNKNYLIKEMEFPKASPYGWNNNPFDYYNIWVANAGQKPFMDEPTLEILTKEYQVIIFKHCYPVSNIKPDQDSANINSWVPTISNYKLQYLALRDKLNEFPDNKFILFTGAMQAKSSITEDEALRAKEFFRWVIDEWDLPNDNIYLWDLYSLQTEGGLYFLDEYAVSPDDSHPGKEFSSNVVKLLFSRIVDVIENNGNETQNTGEPKIIPVN